jgi:hypothetical protein
MAVRLSASRSSQPRSTRKRYYCSIPVFIYKTETSFAINILSPESVQYSFHFGTKCVDVNDMFRVHFGLPTGLFSYRLQTNKKQKQKTNSVAFSPQANYTDFIKYFQLLIFYLLPHAHHLPCHMNLNLLNGQHHSWNTS